MIPAWLVLALARCALAAEADPQDPLARAQRQLRVAVEAGAEQGFETPATMVIPTSEGRSIRIDIHQPGTKPAPLAPPPAPPPDYRPLGLGFALAAFGVWMYMRRKPAAAPVHSLELGETPFTIVRVVGEGGMGVVYEAVDRNLERKVAVKRMRDGGAAGQLLKEAKTVASLHHPNIVDIYSVVSQGGETYIVFEFVEGRTVEEILRERGRLSLAEVRGILEPVCLALEFAHARGVVHRDLKPANVMLTALGQVKVMDFGIARRVSVQDAPGAAAPQLAAHLTQNVIGTPLYLAPEAEFGMIRPEGDVWALGVMAYQMLSGGVPYPAHIGNERKMTRDYPRLTKALPGAPASLEALIDAALEPQPDKRLASPREFRERLAGC